MRSLAITVGLLLLTSCLALAQQSQSAAGQPASAQPPSSAQLDAVLDQWEKQMKGVESLAAVMTRTTVNRTFNTTDVLEGTAKYLKPNRASFELRKKGETQFHEKYVFTGTYTYEFRPQEKVLRVHQPPPPQPGQVADDNVMSFVFGMKAEKAKQRYNLSLHKLEDPHYYYIAVQPRSDEDKQEFTLAWLILLKRNYLPRGFRYVQPNKNEVMYDFPQIEVNSKSVTATDFAKPDPPPGWKLELVPRTNPQAGGNVPPRIARPNREGS